MDKKNTYLKTIIYSILISLFLFSCINKVKKETIASNEKNTFTIKGTTSKKIDSEYIFLIDKNETKLDSSKIEQHSFVLKGKITSADLYYIRLSDNSKKHPFILENSNYSVLINLKEAMIIGGNLNNAFFSYKNMVKTKQEQQAKFYQMFSYKDISLKNYLRKIDSISKKEKKELHEFILHNTNNILPSILLDHENFSSKELIQLKKDLIASNHIRNINKLDLRIEKQKNIELSKKIARRKTAPLFSGTNLLGSRTYLENITKGKKLFLIDFWASWCPPCRDASPKIKKLYEKYYLKGFDILSVSEDRSVTEWKDGIATDGLESWYHIYDDYNRISSLYNVTALPHMVLLDEKGKIIKSKISISELQNELERVLK